MSQVQCHMQFSLVLAVSRAVIGHATLGYLVPRKWFRGLVFVVLSLVVVGAMLLIQEVAIVFFWASSISQSTQQLEAIIPQEVNMKVGLALAACPQT